VPHPGPPSFPLLFLLLLQSHCVAIPQKCIPHQLQFTSSWPPLINQRAPTGLINPHLPQLYPTTPPQNPPSMRGYSPPFSFVLRIFPTQTPTNQGSPHALFAFSNSSLSPLAFVRGLFSSPHENPSTLVLSLAEHPPSFLLATQIIIAPLLPRPFPQIPPTPPST